MADLPLFQFTTQEDWYYEIPFLNADAAGAPLALVDANGTPRVFVALITPAQTGNAIIDPVATLTMGAGNGITFKDSACTTLVFRLPKTTANGFPRGDYTADILEVVSGEQHLFMPVRIRYNEPSAILSFLSRMIGVTFSASRQPIVTPVAIAGRQGVRGPGVFTAARAPLAADGIDGDFWIFDRSSSNQSRLMYGPKVAGVWPGLGWVIQVAGIADVPGLPDALAAKATPADVAAAIANLVASSPAALDTLKELADALGDDPNFAATVTNALANKQPLDTDLSAIAALGTTTFGRSLLTVANQGAAQTALGLAAVAASGSITDLALVNLPSSLPATPGVLWNNGGLLSIS